MVKHPPLHKEALEELMEKKLCTDAIHDAIDTLIRRNALLSRRKTGPFDALIIGESDE